MGVSHLSSIFKPQRIALIGVKNDPNSVGGITLKNLVGGGFNGVVYPVNPKHEAVLGIQCYPNVRSLPKTPDLAVITTGAQLVPGLVQECGEAGINGIIIMTAGFKETGAAGKVLEGELKKVVASFPEMRVIGPNCLGIIVPRLKMNVSFASGMPKDGNVAFISQSGALCTSILDWSYEENIGFSYFVSIGNSMDVEFGDLIDYFGMDPQTKSIVLYVESINEARKFMTAARAFARKKPIIVYKAGRFPESAKAAASHTGAMASEDSIYDAVFQRAGIARVYNIGDIFDFTDLISRRRIPKGANLAIVTNAGGPGVMATDTLIASKGELVKLTDDTMKKLNDYLPPFWSHGNPVDVLGDATPERYAVATEIVLQDPGVDAVLAILTPQAMTDPTSIALEISKLTEKTTKPILTAWLGGKEMREGIQIFNKHNIANYATPEQAISAFMTLADYSHNLDALFETPQDIPVSFPYDRKTTREQVTARLRHELENTDLGKNRTMSEDASKELLEIYGIPTTRPMLAKNKNEAVKIAEEVGYPVVLKIHSPDITHKTDVGGVSLNNRTKESLIGSWDRMMDRVKEKMPQARIEGITVQKMVQEKDAVELILGIKKDPVFGTCILIGMGGVVAELFKDKALGFPPLNEALADNMLKSLKIYPLLTGYRGAPRKNIEKLIEIMIRMSYLSADYPEITELDINPLLVGQENVIALDARIVIDEEIVKNPVPNYSHLILHPYPEEYVTPMTLADGSTITLRPIKPEDEPLWLDMLGSCSKESIYSRFRYDFHYAAHEIATQFCVIDYSREIAIVAEVIEEGTKKLVGVGRLIANLDLDTVEYAILIRDAWQRKDLGNLLTKYSMDVAKHWGLKRIVAETTVDNKPMISVFKKYGFNIHFNSDGSVHVTKEMADYEQTYFFDSN
ncbi:MAG TPA: bifunctional acetate--CoA ligase family protein/GNAT family N-acetyltransferase [Bacteroidales bacterium]|nr:bifunctional acetate--CoA ligase family protein/GNAT family N-acetyltransferase [Bacteroidales bacterium]HNS47254.1 bifunctional acetate--CoA ligase family protein/GNAT family N-acetyltransferase [Bacteroidales bacterium]